MATLIFPLPNDELAVEVLVNLDATSLLAQRSIGKGPAPLQGTGLIDTGSNATGISLPLLHQLGVPVYRHATTHGMGGSVPVDLYLVSIHIREPGNRTGPWFSHPSLLVMGLPGALPIDAIIGMDVLLTWKLVVDGPARQFTLAF